jgi:hypothetical protein
LAAFAHAFGQREVISWIGSDRTELYSLTSSSHASSAHAVRSDIGHHHLLVDADLPPLGQPIPNDFRHLHFGAGETEASRLREWRFFA